MTDFVNINCTTNVVKIKANQPKIKIKQFRSTLFANIVYIMQWKCIREQMGAIHLFFYLKSGQDTDFTETIEIEK